MSRVKIKFWDLGRSKAKGEFIAVGISDEIKNRMLKKFSKHLASSDISFGNGNIFAGFHHVGKYVLVRLSK